jgi:hypothetical protein
VTLPVLEVALARLYREGLCNDGIIAIVVHISEEPFHTFWTEIETTCEDDERYFVKFALSALEVLVRGSQGRQCGITETICAVSENGDDDLQDKRGDARSYDGRETLKTCLAVNLLQVKQIGTAGLGGSTTRTCFIYLYRARRTEQVVVPGVIDEMSIEDVETRG